VVIAIPLFMFYPLVKGFFGKIPPVRIGRVWRYDKEIIDEWIAGNQGK
jgi:hypothetical protein